MIGTTVGSYQIVREIGEGGMGRVYLARHGVIGKLAAIKVLLPEHSKNASLVDRFFNEARSSSVLAHPSLVDVYDFGRLPDGRAFIVMEYLEGESLHARLGREGPLPLERIRDIARQVAAAVGTAHQRGIVHRDLKPENIHLLPDPDTRGGTRAKVLDFGVAKLTDDSPLAATNRTSAGSIIGTPAYMSPEQCEGTGRVDHRADIYSLGCVIFEMAAGRPPFVGEGVGQIIAAHILQAPPSLVGVLPPPYDGAVARMLAKRPEDRFQSMAEVSALMDQEPVTAAGGVVPGAGTGASRSAEVRAARPAPRTSTTLSDTQGEVAVRGGARRVWSQALLVGAVGVALLGAGAAMWPRRTTSKPEPVATPAVAIPTAATVPGAHGGSGPETSSGLPAPPTAATTEKPASGPAEPAASPAAAPTTAAATPGGQTELPPAAAAAIEAPPGATEAPPSDAEAGSRKRSKSRRSSGDRRSSKDAKRPGRNGLVDPFAR
jgi:hypothetical protein